MDFNGQVVIVTGAGSGIGRAVALAYASRGAFVVIAEREYENGLATEEQIRRKGGTATFLEVDIKYLDQVQAMINRAYELYGPINILINNAGIVRKASPYQLSIEDWDEVLNTNLRGAFICSRETAKIMRAHGGGFIVNIASTRAIMSEPYWEAYASSKGGILSLTHAMALSLAPDNIRVNAISPGWIETEDYSELRDIDHFQHPARRVGKPEDIARACLFLSTRENDFITGTNLLVDGGITKKMIYEP